MRRWLLGICGVVLAGCAAAPENDERARGEGAALPPDLATRHTGSDWPCFLGPTGDSVSTEKGIVSPWPREGPKVLWHKKLDTGYAMPTISRGRLFHFDRLRDRAQLQAWKSET